MGFDYKGCVVGVTGGAGVNGIGFAIAKKYLTSGARVFICDLNEEALQEAKQQLAPLGEVLFFQTDVTKETEIQAMLDHVFKEWGQLNIFVNNAGIYPQRSLCEMSEQQWDLVMNVNVKSVFLCSKLAAGCMKDAGGVIVNAASYAALLGSAGSGAYAASKAAVYSMTKTLAAELAPYGIRVNGFIPGVIETGMTKDVISQKKDALVKAIALRRLGTPEEVANAVLFLSSAEAEYLTGTFIEISGGKLCVQNPESAWE